jgi:hypothetical protein
LEQVSFAAAKLEALGQQAGLYWLVIREAFRVSEKHFQLAQKRFKLTGYPRTTKKPFHPAECPISIPKPQPARL